MRHKITNRTIATPKLASYISGTKQEGSDTVQCSYFTESKEPLHFSQVNPAAKFMSLNEFGKLVEGADPHTKDAGPKDLDHGRELTKSEKENIEKPEVIDNDEVLKKKQPVGVNKQATAPKAKGHGKLSAANGQKEKKTEPGKRLSESSDNATYTWKSILRAGTEAGLTPEDMKAMAMTLSGSEITESEDPNADMEAALATDDPNRQTKPEEIFTGQPMRNVYNAIQSLTASESKEVSALPKGTVIKVIRHKDSVNQIIPGKVINISTNGDKIVAKLEVADKTTQIVLGRAGSVFLKRGRETGVYYYLSKIEE